MNGRTVTATVAAGVVLLAAAVIWVVAPPRLTSLTEGLQVCVPANSDGQAMFGMELFRNNTGVPITAATFEPDGAAGMTVIGAYFQPESEGSPGVLNDPKLVPHGFNLEPVPPGARVTVVLGVQLTDAAVAGQFSGACCVPGSRHGSWTASAGRAPATPWCRTGRSAPAADAPVDREHGLGRGAPARRATRVRFRARSPMLVRCRGDESVVLSPPRAPIATLWSPLPRRVPRERPQNRTLVARRAFEPCRRPPDQSERCEQRSDDVATSVARSSATRSAR